MLEGREFIAFERDIPTRKTIDRVLARHRVPSQSPPAQAFMKLFAGITGTA